ncbi:hypothetical protein EXU48_11285 [Occultella glacieicola]|uniref:Uncharacterized protein n=1 Tax=Occultella glacieicola TaxID=2518684 RepID=A0ABY2E337_9MICO|nr:hypothetical protein [Occultella glacieicola]TDE94034.1 hypothetical protein EXU48_11285 [Occultella glacieicola]
MAATSSATAPTSPTTTRTSRAIPFRIVAVLVAATYLVLFGTYRWLLTPWLLLPDDVDHGWTRTPELHAWADTAAAATLAAIGIGALVAAWKPLRRSALVAWVGVLLTVVGVSSIASVLLQQHTGFGGALLQGALTVALTAVPFVFLHPQRRDVLRGGHAGAPDSWPHGALRAGLFALAVAGAALAIGAIVWRVTGSLVENPLEDDVVSFSNLGLTLASGAAIAATGRQGWRSVAVITGAVAAYAVVAAVSLAL